MKFLLISIGTRGDIEPFLAIADMLASKGHAVSCAFPEQFRNLAEDTGVHFYPLSREFIELIGTEDGQTAMGGNISYFKKLKLYCQLYKKSTNINAVLLSQQKSIVQEDQPDRIVYGGKAIYPIIWSIKNPGNAIALSPIPCLIHAVNEMPHVGFNGNYGQLINRATYTLANFGLVKHVVNTTKAIREKAGISRQQIKPAIMKQKMIYTISPALFQRPDYWPQHVKVVGYRERNKTHNWQPDQELTKFMNQHKKILFVTFGSMTNPTPEEKTDILLKILERNNIPAIINTASGGLQKPVNHHSDLIHFIDQIPYDWIFPRVYAVTHHGGSGTTHTALKYGCATMIIPHIIDQFLWNSLLAKKGVGPKGMSIKSYSEKRLEPLLLYLFTNKIYKQKAEELASEMAKEEPDDQFNKFLCS